METNDISSDAEDVHSRLLLAKLDVNDFLQPVQMLRFTQDASAQNVMLLQLDKHLVESIEVGKKLLIRGHEDDAAVLCTEDATYSIKKAMSSNTMILLEDCSTNVEELEPYSATDIDEKQHANVLVRNALGFCSSYLELKRIYPNTARLYKLLQQSLYRGPAHENDIDASKLYTLSDLMDTVQASEEEIVSYLCQINSCCIGGNWRLLDFTYTVKSMEHILQVVEAESWSYTEIPVEKLCETVNDSGELVPNFIVKHLLNCYGTKFASDGINYVELDERKVCRFFCEMLLREVNRLRLTDFVDVMREALPAGMTFDEAHLQGLVVIDRAANDPSIRLFKSEDLPVEIEARMDALFRAKEKWTHEEIVPYIENVCLADQTASSVLSKYARASTSKEGLKVFSSRKPLS